ncbi:unnamed protein product [Owenia fusiformis]|uniref:Uncharacterized protein n=1 Tax=Owenia fusiformis TaxID=6347 RepID=A0A8J1THK2_OWEFU|nr:unnamed protein product [Owenia fusiformis]
MELRVILTRLLTIWVSMVAWITPIYGAKKASFLKKLFRNYDSRIPPAFGSDSSGNGSRGGTMNAVELMILSFDSINESTMDYIVTMFLRQTWNDKRLALNGIVNESSIALDSRMIDNIWVPDLYFYNEKKSHFHDITVPNKLLRIYQNGDILYSSRITLTLSCPMKLHKFPLDTQICSMIIESYAYTADKLMFKWADKDPIKFKKGLELPQFSLKGNSTKSCTTTLSTGTFTCLQANFILERAIGFYIIQTYVPSILVVILSWVSFWISVDAVPARISLGVLTILTMTTQSAGARQTLPKVSYVKAIDIWMSTCLLFVFGGLIEFAVVNVLSRKEVRARMSIRRKPEELNKNEYEMVENGSSKKAPTYIRDPDGKEKARFVDKISRVGFPLVFVIFNGVYWIFYSLWEINEE